MSFTRGHDLKIVKKHSVVNARAFHFSNRVINHWNSLNYSQVHALFSCCFQEEFNMCRQTSFRLKCTDSFVILTRYWHTFELLDS